MQTQTILDCKIMLGSKNNLLDLDTNSQECSTTDYFFLRRKGIEHLEKLTSSVWNDFNAHDPGITLLEQICYALSDLSYRTAHNLPDLICQSGESVYKSLYRPTEILPTAPTNIEDLRKFLLDIPGVNNAWINWAEKSQAIIDLVKRELSMNAQHEMANFSPNISSLYLKGMLEVLIEGYDSPSISSNQTYDQVVRRLNRCRSLGQDFFTVKLSQRQQIGISAVLQIESAQDVTKLLADIYQAIAEYVSPSVPFYSLEAMKQKGKSLDEIFEGPLLDHGFIDTDELLNLKQRSNLQTSDVIHQLMKLPGVAVVKKIAFLSEDGTQNQWSLRIDDNKTAWFKPSQTEIDIQLEQNGIPLVDSQMKQSAIELFNMLRQKTTRPVLNSDLEKSLNPPAGRYRKTGNYTSILQQFPKVYGVGTAGLPNSASQERKTMAKQLKAYLMFFDQLLANQFAQLGNVSKLFSFHEDSLHTYFSQLPTDHESLGMNAVWFSDEDTHLKRLRKLTEDPSSEADSLPNEDRRNRFLDHLLARFAHQFQHSKFLPSQSDNDSSTSSLQTRSKQALLADYVRVGHDRGLGFNYLEVADADNVSGLERVLRHKFGLNPSDKEYEEERFYLIEHILLRPVPDDNHQNGPLLGVSQDIEDPYSLQITLVFPNNSDRYKNQQLVKKIVRDEVPVHLKVHFLWRSEQLMLKIKDAYTNWIQELSAYRQAELNGTNDPTTHTIPFRSARDRLIDLIDFGKTYPLSDLNIVSDQFKVAFGKTTEIPIEHAQLNVDYQLCDSSGNSLGSEFRKSGTGETLYIKTPAIYEDLSYRIETIKTYKRNDLKRRFLNEKAVIEVGVDVGLKLAFQESEDLDLLDPKNLDPKPSDPRIINYGERENINVQVLKTQEGVEYTLLLNGTEVGVGVKGHLGTITLPTGPILEDTHIQVRASRIFSDESEKEDSALLEASLHLKVRAQRHLSASVKSSPIIPFQQDATIIIKNSEENIHYRAWKHEIKDSEFVYGIVDEQDTSLVRVAIDGKPDAQVQIPVNPEPWATSQGGKGYEQVKDSKLGTGGDIELNLPDLEEDTLVIIQASKEHQNSADSESTVTSSIALAQAVLVLVEPNPQPQLKLRAPADTSINAHCTEVCGGQPGVFYSAPEVMTQPIYFHKLDKGINNIRVEIDMAIADSTTKGSNPPLPIIDVPFDAEGSIDFKSARKARTGVEISIQVKATAESDQA
jgi:hypothetical protein